MAENIGTRPDFGHPLPPIRENEIATQTLEEGRLIRMAWDPKKRTYFDIEAPKGLVVGYATDIEPRFTGKKPRVKLWRHFEVVVSPDPRIKVGDIAWEKDEEGKLKPVMHPAFEPKVKPIQDNLGLV